MCNTCGKGFAEQYKLKRHLVSHPESDQLHQMLSSTALPASPKGFPCDTCGKVFPEQYKLKRHLLTHANNVEVKQTLALLTGIKTHSCEKCGKSFTEQAKLKRHMLTHSSEQPSVSVIEKSDISTNSDFVIRLNSATTLTRVKPKNQTVVKEDENSNDDIIEVTRVVPALENPQITELVANAAQEGQTMNDFSCNICGKEFDGMYKLNRHLVTHTGIKNFNCETCGKSFSEAYKLRRHLLVHAGIKMFPCDLCEKSYTRNDHLKRHKHEQHFQNFTCEVCSQEFDDKRALSNHRRIHNPQALKDANKPRTPEKPKGYPCPLCKIEYPDIETCHAHMKSLEHGWKNVHTCEVCHKSFLRKCHLNVHEKIHSDNRPFGCSECGRKFYRSDHLKAHLKTHTNDFNLNGEMSYNMSAAMVGSDPSSDGDSSNHHQGIFIYHFNIFSSWVFCSIHKYFLLFMTF